jgi:hypothetical protein
MSLSPEQFTKTLQNYMKNGVPDMVAGTLNAMAGEAGRLQKKNIEASMNIRNPRYTLGSLRFWQAKPGKDITRINAVVGSVSPYLPVQDAGGEVQPVRGKSKNIPITKTSRAGGSMSGKVLRKYRMDKVTGNRKVVVWHAAKYNNFTGVFLRVKGKLKLLQKLSPQGVKVKGTGWHKNAVLKASESVPLVDRALVKIIRRYIKE